ncbi:MAG: hypothetical protein WCI74_01110 [Actinomycetes bacterium]
MVFSKLVRIGAAAAVGALVVTGVGATSASAAAGDACETVTALASATVLQARHDLAATTMLRKTTLPNNKAKKNKQIAAINKMTKISAKWKKRAVTATKAEYSALAGWYTADYAAGILTSALVVDSAHLGNATETCNTAPKKRTGHEAVDTAQTAVEANLKTFDDDAKANIPNYVTALLVAFSKFNNSKLSLKSVKALIKSVAAATAGVVANTARIPLALKNSDDAAMAALKAALAAI